VEAARAADEAGLDAVGFYDHYHSAKPEWPRRRSRKEQGSAYRAWAISTVMDH
jgi:alkanesulfonate monooxygenase SsuD/methylene tetrahydromethanopterin reductase-like flavin-dependent oxidoreductase (luciferase family)